MRHFTVLVLCAVTLGMTGCGSSSPPAIGDSCLVGRWTLQEDVNNRGYDFNNQAVPVSGLRGATITFGSDGSEARAFDGSAPLVGSVGGHQLTITIGGSLKFRIHASKGNFFEVGAKTELPTRATLDGQPVNYQSYYEPESGTYMCTGTSLTMLTTSGTQTDTWSRG